MYHLLCESCVSEGPCDRGDRVELVESGDRAATRSLSQTCLLFSHVAVLAC